MQAVQKVEKNHILWRTAQLIAKISLVTLAIYFTPIITALIPIAAAAKTLKVSFIAVAVLKDLWLAFGLLGVYTVWNWSYKGLEGVCQIEDMERRAAF